MCVQEYHQLELSSDLESELCNGIEDYQDDRREFPVDNDADDDDDDLSYVETGRSLTMVNITDPAQQGSTLPADMMDFSHDVSDVIDEESDYMALRSVVLYGGKFILYHICSTSFPRATSSS